MVKYTDKSNSIERRVYFSSKFWATYSQSIIAGKPKQLSTPTVKRRERMNACTRALSCLLHSYTVQKPLLREW